MGMCVTHPGAAGGDSPWRRRGTWRGRPPWRRSCRARTCRKPPSPAAGAGKRTRTRGHAGAAGGEASEAAEGVGVGGAGRHGNAASSGAEARRPFHFHGETADGAGKDRVQTWAFLNGSGPDFGGPF